MTDPSKIIAMTNTTPKSCVDVNCDCNTMWSLAQQFSTKRLCTHTGDNAGKLVKNYATRARRIAATYARFYLELEDGGKLERKGRYYWMALGAFASKTVACTFEKWQIKTMTWMTDTVWEGLGKGNFWLFCDVSGWHWYYNNSENSFDLCNYKRDSRNYVQDVKKQLEQLPWSKESLPIINYFKCSKEIISSFEKVKKLEKLQDKKSREKMQLAQLLDVANHEQGIILQPLIYKDKSFSWWIEQQRAPYASWASPALELIFGHACDTNMSELKSKAPDNIKLENLQNRMSWIRDSANTFHTLMIQKNSYMESELTVIASWVDLPDAS